MTREVMQQALKALEKTQVEGYNLPGTAIREAITALRESLAQPAPPEPKGYVAPDLSTLRHSDNCRYWEDSEYCTCAAIEYDELKYWRATPPAAQRPWQGLTENDWAKIEDMPDAFDQGVAWAQARLKEKNT